MSKLRAACFSAVFVIACVASTAAVAGPPFLTDDPQPTDTGHWEIYNFVQGAHTQRDIDTLFEQIDGPVVEHDIDAQIGMLIEERL